MKIGKLLSAMGNLDQIAEGIKNKIFKKDDVEQIAAVRWEACLKCPALDRTGRNCAMPGTQPCCSDCGCALGLKLRALSSSCPKGNWPAIMDGKQENELKKTLYPGLLSEEEEKKEMEKRKKEVKEKKERIEERKKKEGGKKARECSSCDKKMKEKYGEDYKEKLKEKGIHMDIKTTKPKKDE